jgi:hypothetical protein
MALVESPFECWVSAPESRASHSPSLLSSRTLGRVLCRFRTNLDDGFGLLVYSVRSKADVQAMLGFKAR